MELPSRPKHDRYTRPGHYRELEARLRSNPACASLPVLVAYAFDYRTRLGPFLYADVGLLTAGPRAVAAALHNAGFTKTRIVLRQWNPNVRPSLARLDGEIPALLFVSSMQIHSADAYALVEDAHRLGDARPLILAGGAKAIYEPWDFFGHGPDGTIGADVVCTGEEFVFLELLDRLLELRGRGEHPRQAFHRLRRRGLFDDIPGLVFQRGDERARPRELVTTGIQRMVQDLDELPHPIIGCELIEAPHWRKRLDRRPIPVEKLRRHVGMISVVTTHGCKFHCPYCPIPAYNQFTFRYKSPPRLREELEVLAERTGIPYYFGTDDNFFNSRETVEEVFTELVHGKVHGKPFRDALFFGTEATEFDVHKNRDLLPLARAGGLRAIWFGIEDMTAELVKKGQSPEKTKEVFNLLSGMGIAPMPMMMHHDGQPLASRGKLYGLLNQVNFLRRTGAVSLQVTILTPSVGSKSFEEPYSQGMVLESANGRPIQDYHFDGNHCIATTDPRPWRKQFNIYLAYASFYNPLNFVRTVLRWNDPLWAFRLMYQAYGMAGIVRSLWKAKGWLWDLYRGPIRKRTEVPGRRLPLLPPLATERPLLARPQTQAV